MQNCTFSNITVGSPNDTIIPIVENYYKTALMMLTNLRAIVLTYEVPTFLLNGSRIEGLVCTSCTYSPFHVFLRKERDREISVRRNLLVELE